MQLFPRKRFKLFVIYFNDCAGSRRARARAKYSFYGAYREKFDESEFACVRTCVVFHHGAQSLKFRVSTMLYRQQYRITSI